MSEIYLKIEDQLFKANKETLCEFSDYFQAMFSGSYIEKEKNEIEISVVDANSMRKILQYVENGMIDLYSETLSSMGDLAVSANFLQMRELIKQIEFTLDSQLNLNNWVTIQNIAEMASYSKLENLAAAFSLLSFKQMKPKHIPSLDKLYWYLSHPNLDAQSELDVFKFGYEWICNSQTLPPDALLIIFGCLDYKNLNTKDLEAIQIILKDHEDSLALKVCNFLLFMAVQGWNLDSDIVRSNKDVLCKEFTEQVYGEVLNMIRESKSRNLKLIPCVGMWPKKELTSDKQPQYMYKFDEENGLEQWLEVADSNLWGWSVTSWGLNKIVVVGGEYGKGSGVFMRQVAVYDTLRKEWCRHGVEMPPRRHAGVAVLKNQLFVLGGVGAFRVLLASTIAYRLQERIFQKLVDIPDVIQQPAVCTHKEELYVGGQKHIYKFKEYEHTDHWQRNIETDIRVNCMESFEEYIYVTQNYFSHLYRYRPGIDTVLERFAFFSQPVAAICNIGKRLICFNQAMCSSTDPLTVEEFKDDTIRIVRELRQLPLKLNDVAGCCALVMTMPTLQPPVSKYPEKYVQRLSKQND